MLKLTRHFVLEMREADGDGRILHRFYRYIFTFRCKAGMLLKKLRAINANALVHFT